MRIAGEMVDGDTGKNIEVLNPYNGEVVGTVPRASRAQIAGAFEIAANYKPTLPNAVSAKRTASTRSAAPSTFTALPDSSA
jgi:acyl-CoA reductase-like NAD-dependent aldehyde dehydrogenase